MFNFGRYKIPAPPTQGWEGYDRFEAKQVRSLNNADRYPENKFIWIFKLKFTRLYWRVVWNMDTNVSEDMLCTSSGFKSEYFYITCLGHPGATVGIGTRRRIWLALVSRPTSGSNPVGIGNHFRCNNYSANYSSPLMLSLKKIGSKLCYPTRCQASCSVS
jgi:hypothetical protein